MSRDNTQHSSEAKLERTMKIHQVVMLSIGGTIGTGLFIGSGYVINQAGPGGTFLAYGFGALVMYLMMLCLGELLVEKPVAGNIQAYATELIGPSAGFSIGWIKWLGYAVTIPTQLVASSIIMGNVMPNVNPMVWTIVFTALLFMLNTRSAEDYGSSSFIFSSLKLIFIVIFIIVGLGMITGLIGKGGPIGLKNFTNDGGLFPKGGLPVIMSMMSAVFAYSGADMFAAAASESENPEENLPKAINASIWGLIITYMATLFVLIAILPWREAGLTSSPFALIFSQVGLKSAELVVNIFILTSALSSANAHVYSCMRILWSMGNYNQAPKVLAKVNKKKVPMNALIATMAFSAFAVVSSVLSPDLVYLFLTAIIGISEIIIYILYGVCLMLFRRKYIAEGNRVSDLKFKVPLYPLTPILLIVLCITIFVGMFFDPSQQLALRTGIPTFTLLYLGAVIYQKKTGKLSTKPIEEV